MKKIIFLLLMAIMMPSVAVASEYVVTLRMLPLEIVPDVNPMDDAKTDETGDGSVSPNSFRVVVSGKDLSVTKQDDSVASADVVVVKTTTGEVVVNEAITDDIVRQIPSNGNYTISIQTSNAALVGHFVVR